MILREYACCKKHIPSPELDILFLRHFYCKYFGGCNKYVKERKIERNFQKIIGKSK